jgi:hypothetical protein
MLPLSDARKLLGPAAANLSDEEIRRIQERVIALGHIIFERWLKHRQPPDSKKS